MPPRTPPQRNPSSRPPLTHTRTSSYTKTLNQPIITTSPTTTTTTTTTTNGKTPYHDDVNDHHQNSPLHFSPSKARAHAAQTQQLTLLSRWLGSVLDDRGPATLLTKWQAEQQVLMTAATSSDADLAADMTAWLQGAMESNRLANERRRLLYEATKAEVESRAREAQRDVKVVGDVLAELHGGITGEARAALDSLAETAVALGLIPMVDSSVALKRELGQAVVEHTVRAYEVHEQIEGLRRLQGSLSKEAERARLRFEEVDGQRREVLEEAEHVRPQTVQWSRETKQIAVKIKEYQERMAALERSRPGSGSVLRSEDRIVRVEEVLSLQQRVEERRATTAELEETLKALNGLPPDLEASRQEVQRAKLELERLKARREGLFTMIAER